MLSIQNPWCNTYAYSLDATVDLYCFHHAGGAASFYYPWKDNFINKINLYSVQLPGRENRFAEPFMNNAQELATAIANNIAIETRPFIFFGHSLGGLLAFEVSRYLRKLKQPEPLHLFISAHKAPQLPFKEKALLQQEDQQLINRIIDLYDGFPIEVLKHPELLELMLIRLRSDLSICINYQYIEEAPLNVPITLLHGLNDKSVTPEEIEAWQTQTRSAFKHQTFNDGHFYLEKEYPNITKLINRLVL